jgi:hypothetical protein
MSSSGLAESRRTAARLQVESLVANLDIVEIKTDSRGVIDYLLSPLARIASEAARER